MATYRKDGFKFNRANLRGIDADTLKGINAFLSSREREINTFSTSVTTYSEGPFAGQSVELCEQSPGMLPLNFKGWNGHYDGAKWIGTIGEPLAIVESGDLAKPKDCNLGKGFSELGDLFATMGEDPEDYSVMVLTDKGISIAQNGQDDYGNALENPQRRGIWSINRELVAFEPAKSRSRGGREIWRDIVQPYHDSAVSCTFMDDFGSLVNAPALKNSRNITVKVAKKMAVYTIGRTTYRVNATAARISELRAAILSKKRFFADKLIQQARPARSPEKLVQDAEQAQWIEARAAESVAELVASATAAAVIEQASEAAPIATPDECEAGRELATVDACSESEATATSCDASSAGNAPSAPHVVYSQLKPGDAFRLYPHGAVYIKTRGGHRPGRGGPLDRAYEGRTVYRWYGDERDQAPAVSTPAPAVHTAPAPAAPTFQTIIGKSGNWCARFRRLPDGDHVLEFSTRPNDWSIYVYKTGRERMAALQAMARQADQDAQPDDQDDPQTERERRLNAFDAMTATAADVHAMGAEYVAQLLEDLEDINYHTEGLILQCLAAGREDLAARARANLREHLAAGYLTDALREDRQAISEALRQSTDPDPTHPAADTPSSAPAGAPGYPTPAPDQHQQTAPVPNLADKVPRAVGADSGPASIPTSATAPSAPAPATEASADESEPEFTRTRPQPFDMLAMIAAGLAPADFVGLGIVYGGDRANPSGRGAITDVQPCSWYKYTVTVTLEDGRQSRLNPVSFTDHLGNRYRTDLKRHGAPYLAELAAARLAVEAADKAAKQAAADDKARQRRELPQQWPQLKAYDPAGKLNGPTLAAHNIRVLLKERFPKIKFSVKSDRYSGGDSIDIRWTDGPNTKAVEKIAGRFEAGSFNGQEDIYEYAHSVFRDLFGDAKYIHCNRDISDALLSQAIEAEYPNAEGRPTVDDYRKARGAFSYEHRNEWAARRIRERLETMGAGLPS